MALVLRVEAEYAHRLGSLVGPLVLVPAEADDHHVRVLRPAFVTGSFWPRVLHADIPDLRIVGVHQIEERRRKLVVELGIDMPES